MAEYNLTAANNYTSNNILSLDNNTSTNGLYTNVGSINFNIIGNSSLNNPNTTLIRGNNINPPLLNNIPSPLSNKSSQNNRKTPTTTTNNQINLVNLQQQQQQQQQKNPNRNKKVKDLILDMRLQSQQQQQQQQIQEHQIYHQPMTNNHELSHHHMENNNHQHHQLPPPEMISDQFHFNTSSYFPKPNLNQPQTSNPPLHHHQLDLTPSQQSSNHLMELNLNSASYLNLDDSNTHPSKSITLNCLNSNSAANNNSNIDLIQLLNSTNTTIDDCNNLYNNNPSIQPQIQQNKTLIDLNNHHNNHHHQELIIPYHLHQQQLIQSHHNSSLSQPIHQPHHLNGVTNGSHDPLCGGNDIDECHGINQHQHQHQHHEPDDNLLLYNILNKLSNQPSNQSNLTASNQLVNTDNSKQTTSSNTATASSVSSTSSLLLLSATNSEYNSSPPQQQQQQPASSEKKLDSSEYISLMINQPQQAINTPPQSQNKSSTYATLQPASTDLDQKIQLLPAPKQEKFDNYTSSTQVENNRNEQYLNMNHVVENTSQQILPTKKTEKSKVNSPNNNNMMMMINTANKHEEMTSSASSTSSSSPADNNNNNESNGYNSASHLNKPIASPTNAQMEELNTKELAHRISSELKRYSIPQAVFAQRVLCRSQGTLSDLLRNPKPWSKLKSGRETFRRMFKWLQEPEAQRMNSLRLAAATKRKEDGDTSSFTNPDDPNDENNNNTDGENAFDDEDVVVGSGGGGVGMVVAGGGVGVGVGPPMVDCDDDDDFMTSGEENQSTSSPRPLSSRKSLSILNDSQYQQQSSHSGVKKPRLVFTDIQRRTLQAIFKETKRPSKEMQMTIAQQLDLEVATVSNFFMNARRRSMDKWKDQDDDNSNSSGAK